MRARTIATLGGLTSAAAVLWVRPWRYRARTSDLLDEFLTDYEFSDTVSLEMDAAPERALHAFRQVTLRDMPIVRLLTTLRALPQGKGPSVLAADLDQPLCAVLRSGTGTIVLADAPRELALGMAGRFHALTDQAPQPLSGAHAFGAFDRPGFEKLAMSVRAIPGEAGVTRVVLEHRTHAIGPAARLRFALYWLAVKPVGALVGYLLLRAMREIATRPAEPTVSTGAEEAGVTELVDDLEASFA